MSPPPARMTATARLQQPDWCHFTQRLPRSRAHKQIKGAELPFEDEKFAYVALTRAAVGPRRPRAGTAGCRQGRDYGKLCTHDGLELARVHAAPRPTMQAPGAGAGAMRSRNPFKPFSLDYYLDRLAPNPRSNARVVAPCRMGDFELIRPCSDQASPNSRRAAARPGFSSRCHASSFHQEFSLMSTGWIVLGVIVVLVLFVRRL